MGKLSDKIALITGSTSGIGAECAREYAKEGAKVIVTGRNADRGTAVVEEIQEQGGQAAFIQSDVKSEEDLKRLAADSLQAFGGLDILVNNSGMYFVGQFEEYSTQIWNDLFDTNVRAIYILVRELLPHLVKSKSPVILNIASVSALTVNVGDIGYGASKAAAVQLTKSMAKNFAAQKVRVNTICPGIIQTPIFGGQDMSFYGANIPLGRIGNVHETAKPAVFLVSDDASYITGAVLTVEGGLSL